MCGDQGGCEKGDKRGRLDYATDKIMMMATTHPAITLRHESQVLSYHEKSRRLTDVGFVTPTTKTLLPHLAP